jgi:hypothetical protein
MVAVIANVDRGIAVLNVITEAGGRDRNTAGDGWLKQ